MSSDTWGTIDELIETPKDAPITPLASVAVRSDGDVIVLYAGDVDAVMGTSYQRTDYARKEASWTVGVNVGGQGQEDNHYGGAVVRGASDRMHFFWNNLTSTTYLHRSLSSANAIDTAATVDATAFNADRILGSGISYVSGSNTVVKCPYLDAGNKVSIARIDVSQADPTITVDADASDATASHTNTRFGL